MSKLTNLIDIEHTLVIDELVHFLEDLDTIRSALSHAAVHRSVAVPALADIVALFEVFLEGHQVVFQHLLNDFAALSAFFGTGLHLHFHCDHLGAERS